LNNDGDEKNNRLIHWSESNYCPGVDIFKLKTTTVSNIGNFSYGYNSIHGLKLNENIALGLGVGIDKNDYATLLPISIDGRIALSRGKISPTLSAKLGYSIGLGENEGGLIFNPKVGLRISLNSNLSYIFNVGYKWQNIEYSTYYNDYVGGGVWYPVLLDTYKVQLKFVTISTGFEF
jgi:hypothetical protein